jgi:hypothetical protein
MLPEIRDAVRAVGAGKRLLQRAQIVGVGTYDLRAEPCEIPCGFTVGSSRERADDKSTGRIVKQRAGDAAALRSSCSENRDDAFARHDAL